MNLNRRELMAAAVGAAGAAVLPKQRKWKISEWSQCWPFPEMNRQHPNLSIVKRYNWRTGEVEWYRDAQGRFLSESEYNRRHAILARLHESNVRRFRCQHSMSTSVTAT